MDYIDILVLMIEIAGTIAFAVSGAMLAIEKKMDLFGICVLGVVTAVGGGMIRDVMLQKIPSALLNPVYTVVAAVTSVIVFLVVSAIKRDRFRSVNYIVYYGIMLLMDAAGLGIFTVVGVKAGITAGYGDKTFLLTFLGVITGVGGGVIRDMMAQKAPSILVKHIYACASIAGAVGYILIYRMIGEVPALIITPVMVVLIRVLAAHYRWNLPRLS